MYTFSHLLVNPHFHAENLALAHAQALAKAQQQQQNRDQSGEQQQQQQQQQQQHRQRTPSLPATATAAHHERKRKDTMVSVSSESTCHSTHSSADSQSSFCHASHHSHFPPLIPRGGRTWIGDPTQAYPLPCDPPEVSRQTLHTVCVSDCFGGLFCSPYFKEKPPQRVLEVACGAGVWTHMLHNHFKEKGHGDIEYHGVDIVDIAPDFRKQGINWTFNQVDLREEKLPYPEEYFDFIFVKDTSLIYTIAPSTAELWLKHLKKGGVIEVWESDHVFRTLTPNPPPAPGLPKEYYEQAEKTRTYTISAGTPWRDASNKHLKDYNEWIRSTLSQRRLLATPCSAISLTFTTETDTLVSNGSRRIAIPLGEMQWEKEDPDIPALTESQAALRRIVLRNTIGMMLSLEKSLVEASGKTPEEWNRWWSVMSSELEKAEGVDTGECLEVGAWWGQKA